MTMECDCGEQYGPCETHCDLLALREGAPHRTADELAHVFLIDAADIIRGTDSELGGKVDAIAAQYDFSGWLEGENESQQLDDDMIMVESWLPAGTLCLWDDGYRLVRVHDDCPLG